MGSAAGMLSKARSQLGYQERVGNRTKYGAWYGLDGEAWCDMFISWVAAYSGNASAVGKFSYTPAHAQWFIDHGRWGHTPRVGAIVFYIWPGMSRISHVGIVESVRSDGSIVAIEGNTNSLGLSRTGGGVYRVVRRSHIAGYGYPAYSTTSSSGGTPSGTLVVDGDFGPATIRALQKAIGTKVDGILGSGTKRALQRFLGVTADGIIGKVTVSALQKRVDASPVDGIWGKGTTKALQRDLQDGKI